MPAITVTREFGRIWPERWKAGGIHGQSFYAMTKKRAIKKALRSWEQYEAETVQIGPTSADLALRDAARRYVDGEITVEQLEEFVR